VTAFVPFFWECTFGCIYTFYSVYMNQACVYTASILWWQMSSIKPSSVFQEHLGYWGIIISCYFGWLYVVEWVMRACFPQCKVRAESSMIPYESLHMREIQTGRRIESFCSQERGFESSVRHVPLSSWPSSLL